MAKYGKTAQKYVEKEMHEYKYHKRWKNPKQAIAVGLSEAKKHGVNIPAREKN